MEKKSFGATAQVKNDTVSAQGTLYGMIELNEKTRDLSLMLNMMKPAWQSLVSKMLIHRIVTGKDPKITSLPLALLYIFLSNYVLEMELTEGNVEPHRSSIQEKPIIVNAKVAIRNLRNQLFNRKGGKA